MSKNSVLVASAPATLATSIMTAGAQVPAVTDGRIYLWQW